MWIGSNDWTPIHNMEYLWIKNLFTKSELGRVEMEKSKYHITIGMLWMHVKQKNWTIYAWVYSQNSFAKCFYNRDSIENWEVKANREIYV